MPIGHTLAKLIRVVLRTDTELERRIKIKVSTLLSLYEEYIVSKKLLSALFGAGLAALALSPAAFAEDQTLSDFHTEMDGCEVCHEEGSPSADGEFEFEQCQSCHGGMDEMNAVHQPHDGALMCADCHAPHDANVGDKPACDSCHDDGRTAESTLK